MLYFVFAINTPEKYKLNCSQTQEQSVTNLPLATDSMVKQILIILKNLQSEITQI